MKKTLVLPKETSVSTGNEQEQPPTSIPTVPVLQSPPPFWLHAQQPPSSAQLANTPFTDKSNTDSVSGTNVNSSDAADAACNVLINVPKMRAATPKPPS